MKFSRVSDLQGIKIHIFQIPFSHWLCRSSLQQCCATAQPVMTSKVDGKTGTLTPL